TVESELLLLVDVPRGGRLFDQVAEWPFIFDEATARFHAAQLLLALQAILAGGIVYVDLRPDVLWVDARGHLVLYDAALLIEGGWHGGAAYRDDLAISPYQPPEVVRPQPDRPPTASCVLWSFGCILHQMLGGQPPFDDDGTPSG